MKKKIFLTLVMTLMLVLVLALAVSAESVHSGKVDLNQKVTLSDGTECALFDADGDALTWYLDASGALKSIKTQDERVLFYCTYQFGVGNSTVGSVTAYEVSKIEIALESGTLACSSIVVFNAMDDDVLTNGGTSRLNNPVNCVRSNTFINSTNLQYAFLRLDTVALQSGAFQGCTNLKYVNLADLTELRQLGGGGCFNNCTSFMVGEVLDLSNTKLCAIQGSGVFNNVKLAGLILPNTVAELGDWNLQGMGLTSFAVPTSVTALYNSTFNDSKSLKTIYINNTLTKVNDRVFNNTGLEKIFYVGTLEQLTAFLDNSSTTNNAPFWAVVGENRANLISYEDYKKLEDKSGKYVVYNYSYCEAYSNGVHTLDPEKSNPCAGICGICNEVALAANPIHDYVTTIAYANYLANGVKTLTCQNDGCAHKIAPVEITVNPIIPCFMGYSIKEDGSGITFGYTIDYNALDEFAKISGKNVELGFVVAAQSKVTDNKLLNEDGTVVNANVVKASVVSWSNVDTENANVVKYYGADFKLTGDFTGLENTVICMAGYLFDGKVAYLNANASGESADFITYGELVTANEEE